MNETFSQLAKIAPPRLQRLLARPRLFARLDAGHAQRIVWIAGPPGAGKTSLVSSYIAERRLRAIWYQVDAGDADVASFFHYLRLALTAASPRDRKPLPPLLPLTPEHLPGLMTFTRGFFAMLGQRLEAPAVIVLDNYEDVAPDAPLHEVLREAAESLPSGLSFLVLSRSDPPAAFARLRLHGDLVLLGWNDLQLSLEEAHGIASLRSPAASESGVAEMHEDTQGWVAGLVLLLAQGGDLDPHTHLSGVKGQQLLFDYFATELFERLAPAIQAALLRTSLLPSMTVRQAEQLTGEATVGDVLLDLHRRNYFVVLRANTEFLYEYHPLFRKFLLNRAQAVFEQSEWRTLQRHAAELLEGSSQTEAAAHLYLAAEDWNGLKRLALREAPALIAAGRHLTLTQWLSGLPQTAYEHAPWLWYWQGQARLPFTPVEARGIFEHAYLGFLGQDDAVGLYSTWAAVMDTFFFEWRDFAPADRWISEFDQLRARHPEYPSRAIELRTYWAMGTLLHRQPQHPMVPAWSERALALLDIDHRDLSILVGGDLIICFLWRGETVKARGVIDRVAPWAQAPDIAPVVFILWSCAVALYHSVQGETEPCRKSIEEGLGLAQQTGLHAFDFLLAAQMARCSLVAGRPAEAEVWMSSMAKTMRSDSHINGAFYRHLHSNVAAQRGDWHQALEHARTGLAMALDSGVPFLEAHCRIDLARALLGQGDGVEWAEHLHAARAIGQAMGSRVLQYLCLEAEAKAAFKLGKEGPGLDRLTEALALSRAMDGATWLMDGPHVCARLYDRALNAGIEVDHVQRLIRRRELTPPDPATAAESWPWPIRVYTLGRFEIVRDDKPLRSSGKAQRKPLELLKCLCAFGGHAVNQDRLTDNLWPDAHGDAAEQSLRTTLYRLRKLLQSEQAVRLEDRHLHLEPCWIWVDCLAFDRAAHLPEPTDRDSLQRALNRYRGPFLDGESAPWALAFRERLRANYMSMAERLGTMLEHDRDWSGAIECYLRAIEVEPVAENFYRRLMISYAQLGRRAEALAVHRRCCQSLVTRLGISPTQETQALYQQLHGT